MTNTKYKCDECNKELSVGYIRFHQMVDISYELKKKNKLLLKFVKKISALEDVNRRVAMSIRISAIDLLKEIGELS